MESKARPNPEAPSQKKTSRAQVGVSLSANICEVYGYRLAWQEAFCKPSPIHPVASSPGPSKATTPQLVPILALHDAGSGSREFHPLLSRAPAGSRLICLDWPGHGRSQSASAALQDAPCTLDHSISTLRAFLQELQLDRPILLASGFSAAVALRYAASFPNSVRGLVLCQPAGLFPGNSSEAQTASRRGLSPAALVRRIPGLSPTGPRVERADPSFKISPATRQKLRLYSVRSQMQPVLAQAEQSLRQAQPQLHSLLPTLSCPILFALSRDNRQFPLRRYLSLLDPLLAAAPQHRFTVFSGSFHPVWDEPDRFAQALTGFFQSQLPLALHQHAWLLTAVDWPTRDLNLWKCVHPECPAEHICQTGENPNQRPNPVESANPL